MEYLLLGVLVLGVVLFVLGWMVMAGICFQRHAVTGFISLIPGVNLLTLPAMWHRVGGWVITSVIGLLLVSGAWFAGAGTHVYSRAQAMGLNVTAPVAVAPVVSAPVTGGAPAATPQTQAIDIPKQTQAPVASAPVAIAPPVAVAPPEPVDVLAGAKTLPAAALFHVVFKPIEVKALKDKTGQYVRITQNDGSKHEGKLLSASDSEIGLEERQSGTAVTRHMKLTEIRDVALMTHEQD
ncbi:hypothetical protein [Thiothrix lacustris]|uniref:hypothetical protein n=1 Tax=Thiothrix lacustris TaxID=525917 RepID=UPI00048F1592|nr:hypothetical protein [Thiothrix lacustris]